MTPTPEQTAAVAETFGVVVTPRAPAYLSDTVQSLVAAGCFDAAATAILAALPDWTLVPTGEVERLRAALEAIGAKIAAASYHRNYRATAIDIHGIANRALAGDAP